MKKKYCIYLDEKPSAIVQTYLRTAAGLSFSGFLNLLMVGFAKEIEGQPTVFDKKFSEMTLEEFGRLMNYWYPRVKEEKE